MHVRDVVVADETIHEPDVPIITWFELGVILKPVPVIVNIILFCTIEVTVGV